MVAAGEDSEADSMGRHRCTNDAGSLWLILVVIAAFLGLLAQSEFLLGLGKLQGDKDLAKWNILVADDLRVTGASGGVDENA